MILSRSCGSFPDHFYPFLADSSVDPWYSLRAKDGLSQLVMNLNSKVLFRLRS